MDRSRLGEILLKSGKITETQLKTAVKYQESTGHKLDVIVTKLGFISDVELTKLIAEAQHLDVVDPFEIQIPDSAHATLSEEVVRKHQIVPIKLEGETLTVIMSDPTDIESLEEIQFRTGLRVEVVLAARNQITKFITQYYDKTLKKPGKKKEPKIEEAAPAPAAAQAAPAAAPALAPKDDAAPRRETKKTKAPTATLGVNFELTSWEMRRALIPLLIDKGIITREELEEKAGSMFGE
ncbi:MAG: hypothetical protein NUW37_05160 [Planctomycetes bacterium]|nr:hypothetical protein [Planctomycetota bacterium]